MSDYERNKFYGKKKFSNQRSESTFNSRCFNNKGNYNKDESSKEEKEDKGKSIKQPTILLKNRDRNEDRSVSPHRNAKETEPIITIANNSVTETIPVLAKEMTKSVKLLEDGVLYSEGLQDYLQENNDFVVVGVVGPQGVGKSTILNLLSQSKLSKKFKKELFNQKELQHKDINSFENIKILTENLADLNSADDKDNLVFKIEDTPDIEANCNATHGVDIYVTKDRLLLLDSQPIMSMSVLDDLMRSESKRMSVISEFLPVENSGEIQALQLTTFLMSVCHVIIFVQDWFFDSNIIRFLETAEMLRPTISNLEDELTDHFPHLILLHNKAQMDDFTPTKFKLMQQFYSKVFAKTKMHLISAAGLGTGQFIPSLSPEACGDAINLYLIPEYDIKSGHIFNGHPPLEELVQKLRALIMGITKYPLSHVQLSEKNWLLYCGKVWEHVRKSSFFVEYTKQMP